MRRLLLAAGLAVLSLPAMAREQLPPAIAQLAANPAGGRAALGLATVASTGAASDLTGLAGVYAPLTSPALIGVPTAPTPAGADNTTKIATTSFVMTATGALSTTYAPLASPTFTGTVTIPTPSGGDNSTNAASTAFVVSGFLPKASPTFTGLMTGPQWTSSTNLAIGNQWFNINSVNWTGSFGTSGNTMAAMSGVWNDQANNYSGGPADILRLQDGLKSTSAGGRQVIEAVVTQTVSNAPGDYGNASQYVGVVGTVSSNVIHGQTGQVSGQGIYGGFSYDASLTGLYTQTTGKVGSGGWNNVVGAQINSALAAGVTASRHIGVAVSESGQANASATYVDAAYLVGEQSNNGNPTVGWLNGYQIGTVLGQFPLPSNGIAFNVVPKIYGGTSAATFDRGIEFRASTIATCAWCSVNAGIDGSGNISGATISTPGGIAGKAATLTSVTVQDGGSYAGVPTISVQGPPSGVTATITAPTMGGESVKSFGSTGTAYTASTSGGDTLSTVGGTGGAVTFSLYNGTSTGSSISGNTLTIGTVTAGKFGPGQVISGGTVTAGTRILWQASGTAFGAGTYQVDQSQTVSSAAISGASVDGTGRILALFVASNGSLTAAPANPIQLSGGTGSGAWINMTGWANNGTFFPQTAYVSPSSPGSVPWQFATTGDNNYAVGSVLSVTGDTGTAVQLTIAAVINAGAISTTPGATGPISYYTAPDGTLQPGLTVSTVGSLTAVAAPVFHATSNITGTGTGASLMTAYKVLTAPPAVAGSGYVAAPPPLITTSVTYWRVANLLAVMTPALAPLPLTCSTCTVNAAPMGRFVSPPGSSTAACATGDFSADASYIYACRAANTWTRSAAVGGW